MFSFVLIAGAIACSMPQTDYCGTNELEPVNLEMLFADDKDDDYYRLYLKSDKVMYLDGKPYFELDHYPMSEGK